MCIRDSYKSNAEGILIEGIEILPEFLLKSNIKEIKSGQIILGDGLAKKMEIQILHTLEVQLLIIILEV